MRHRNALKVMLGVALGALLLTLTWSTLAARLSVTSPSRSTVEFNNASHTNSAHLTPRSLLPQGPVIITDKLDYHAGEMVTITGTGWQPGETVRLQIDENPNNDGPHIFYPVADTAGNLIDTECVLIAEDQGVSFVLTATGLLSGLTATANFTDGGNLGNGRLFSVVPTDGGCVFDDKVPSTAVEAWDVQPGKTYTITLTNVTDCANGGTDSSIQIVIHSSSTGNTCLTANKTATGTYTFNFTVPANACLTYPIEYCTSNCQPGTGMFARRSDGVAKESHLSAATFGDGCSNPTPISTCTTQPQGCLLPILDPVDLGCNPSSIPTCDPGSITPTGCIKVSVTCSSSDTTTGCVHTRTLTYSATGCDNVVCTTSQIITWKVVTAPKFTNCPTDSNLGCNPASVPSCDGSVAATDECGAATVTCSSSDSVSGCTHTRTLTYTATGACGQTSTCVQHITWKVVTAPKFTNCPTDSNLGCNPASVPSCDGSVAATDECGAATVTCSFSDSVSGCTHTRTLTYTATGACGQTSTCVQHIMWTVDAGPSISCPSNITKAGAGACSVSVPFTVTPSGGCGTLSVSCVASGATTGPVNSGDKFNVGVTTVTCTVTDAAPCNLTASCSFTITVLGQICATKFYDANADGTQNNGETGIQGWKITVTDASNTSTSATTGANGTVCFDVPAGTYTVAEVLPPGNWVATTATTQSLTVDSNHCSASASFGNYCFKPPSNGLTLGFWSNKNGQTILKDNDATWRTLLNNLNLRNADGTCFIVPAGSFSTAYATFRTWLLGATATNMAYMLSAQLAATTLDVAYNGLSDGQGVIIPGGVTTLDHVCIVPFLSVVQTLGAATTTSCLVGSPPCPALNQPLLALTAVPGSTACGCTSNNGLVTIGALRAAAVALLCSYGNTTSAGTARTYEECVKDILDMINNNGNPPGSSAYPCGGITQFISATPCPFTYPK